MRSLRILTPLLGTALLTSAPRADIHPEWISALDLGTDLGSTIADMAVDAQGITYVTGTVGDANNTDVLTAAFDTDGSLLWSHRFDSPSQGSEQARGLALGPFAEVYVCGSTPGPFGFGQVLLLRYNALTGELQNDISYSSDPFTAESGQDVAVDALGFPYVGGNTVGDGTDSMVVKFDPFGTVQWREEYDGAAFGPFSQDYFTELQVAPDGDVVALVHGVSGFLHPDYVVWKLAAADGSLVWRESWGGSGAESPTDMELDAAGDIYVAGTALNFTDQFGTIKLRGTDGQLLWEAYDANGFDDRVQGLALDGVGGVYVTGQSDPDGDDSNFNDDYFTVKRDAATGAQVWTHAFGDACVGCFDNPADVAIDAAGNVFVAGGSSSSGYTNDLVTLVLDATTGLEVDRSVVSGWPDQPASTGMLAFDGGFALHQGGSFKNPDTGEVALTVTRFTTLASTSYRMNVPELFGGTLTTLEVQHATPGASQFLAYSVTGTATLPILPLGTDLGLANPFLLATGVADGGGTFSLPAPVPTGATGLKVWLQSVELGASTPVVQRTFL